MNEVIHNGIHLRELLPQFPTYFAGEDGQIWSLKRGVYKPLKPVPIYVNPITKHPILYVTLYSDSIRYWRRRRGKNPLWVKRPIPRPVHLLIASQWLPPRPSPRHQIDHRDEKRANNRPDNLRWLTVQQNVHAYLRNHPEAHAGINNPRHVLTEEEVYAIRELRGVEVSRVVAGRFGVSKSTVQGIWQRRVWRHLPERPGYTDALTEARAAAKGDSACLLVQALPPNFDGAVVLLAPLARVVPRGEGSCAPKGSPQS